MKYKIGDKVKIIGDDGPTTLNNYNGLCTIYALVIGPDGIETENT